MSKRLIIFSPCRAPQPDKRGVALVLTLLIISMLVVVVVGFTASTRTEQIAARNANYTILAEQLARDATGRALQKLGTALAETPAGELLATQPGRISRRDASAVNLFSVGNGVNINTLPGPAWVTGEPGDAVNVGWENVQDSQGRVIGRVAYYVDDESAKVPLNAAHTNPPTLNPVGSRAFSFGAFIHAGAATTNDSAAFAIVINSNFPNNSISNWSFFFLPEQARASVFTSTVTTNFSSAAEARWVRISRRFTVAKETNPAFAQVTPWGTPKVRLNQIPMTEEGIDQLAAAMTNAALRNIFGGDFGDKYGPQGVRQIAANMLQLRGGYWSANYLATRSTNFGRVLEDVFVFGASSVTNREANFPIPPDGGMRKKTNAIPPDIMGYVPFPMLAEVAVGGLEYGFTIGAGGAAVGPPDDNMTIRFFVACKLFNPFPARYRGGGEIVVQIDKARVRMTNANPSTLSAETDLQIWRGPDGSHRQLTPGYNDMPAAGGEQPWDPWGQNSGIVAFERPEPQPEGEGDFAPPARKLNPPNGITRTNLPPIGPGETANVFLAFDIVTSARHETTALYTGPGAEMYVIIDQVRLLATPGQADTVRDWCSGPDMRAAFGQENTTQFILPLTPAVAREGDFAGGSIYSPRSAPPPATLDPSRWVAIAKADPRVKPGFDLAAEKRAWRTAAATLDADGTKLAFGPTDFLRERIPSDPAYGNNPTMAVFNTNIPPIIQFFNANFSLPADVGKVFTDQPWRTLRMQPQPSNEAGLIPDWVLLDMFDFTAGTAAVPTVNPNFRYATAGALSGGFGAGLRSLLGMLTNAATGPPALLADPMNPGGPRAGNNDLAAAALRIPTGAAFTNLINTVGQLNSPGSWSVNGWGTRRLERMFPSGALMLPSEIAELNGFANYVTDTNQLKLNEYRLGALLPALNTRGRFFKIYAVGQAFEGTNASTVASTRFLHTLVELNHTTTPVSVRTILEYAPPN